MPLTPDEFVARIEPHRDALWRLARHGVRDDADAEDCLQEAFAIALGKLDVFAPGTNARAWMFRILANVLLSHRGRRRRESERTAPIEPDLVAVLDRERAYDAVLRAPQDVVDHVSDPVRRALGVLSPTERVVFLLRAVEGVPYREIAEVVDAPLGTVMSHLFRARARLRQVLAGYAQDEGFVRSP